MLFRKLRKLPAERVAISQVAKASRGARGRFAGCESFPRSAWPFRKLRKFLVERMAFSSGWKVSCGARGVFQRLENPLRERLSLYFSFLFFLVNRFDLFLLEIEQFPEVHHFPAQDDAGARFGDLALQEALVVLVVEELHVA